MVNSKKERKIFYHPDEHIPNKNESKMLRKLCSKNKMSKDEVRLSKKNRTLLSNASKVKEIFYFGYVEKQYKYIIKKACKTTGLVPQHPKTIEVIKEIIKNSYQTYNLTAEEIVRRYAK